MTVNPTVVPATTVAGVPETSTWVAAPGTTSVVSDPVRASAGSVTDRVCVPVVPNVTPLVNVWVPSSAPAPVVNVYVAGANVAFPSVDETVTVPA